MAYVFDLILNVAVAGVGSRNFMWIGRVNVFLFIVYLLSVDPIHFGLEGQCYESRMYGDKHRYELDHFVSLRSIRRRTGYA